MRKDNQIKKGVVMLEKVMSTDKAGRLTVWKMRLLMSTSSSRITQQPDQTFKLPFNTLFCEIGLHLKVFAHEVWTCTRKSHLNHNALPKLIYKSLSLLFSSQCKHWLLQCSCSTNIPEGLGSVEFSICYFMIFSLFVNSQNMWT